jgi:hypothetical protein
MQPRKFEATPEFAHFKAVMKGVLAVPKAELDALVEQSAKESPRKGDPNSPGKKTVIKRRKRIRL